jgi:hypothetical protein
MLAVAVAVLIRPVPLDHGVVVGHCQSLARVFNGGEGSCWANAALRRAYVDEALWFGLLGSGLILVRRPRLVVWALRLAVGLGVAVSTVLALSVMIAPMDTSRAAGVPGGLLACYFPLLLLASSRRRGSIAPIDKSS